MFTSSSHEGNANQTQRAIISFQSEWPLSKKQKVTYASDIKGGKRSSYTAGMNVN